MKYQNIKISKFQNDRGVAVLPLVIIASFLVLIIGAAVAFITFFENQMTFSARKAAEALTTAQAGVNDALQKILRDRNLEGDYILTIDGATASTTVSRFKALNCSDTLVPGYTCVDSLGIAQNRQKKVRAVVSVDPDTGRVVVVSIKEVEI